MLSSLEVNPVGFLVERNAVLSLQQVCMYPEGPSLLGILSPPATPVYVTVVILIYETTY